MEWHGYAGKILYVDLTNNNVVRKPLDLDVAKRFIGGCGISLKLLSDLLEPGTHPLSPENPLIIGAGPLVGTLVPSSSKIQIVTKFTTPANREQSRYYIGIASGGGHRFGLMMKNAGYDQIVITGRAERPVYLRIRNDQVEICKADELWGKKDVSQTVDALSTRHKGSGAVAIGKAGENLVSSALPFVDGRATIGRGGPGAVMGSKNLKAVVVYGNKGIKAWDPIRLMTLTKDVHQKQIRLPFFTKPSVATWRLGKEWATFYPPEIWENTRIKSGTCGACLISCKGLHEIKDGEWTGLRWSTGVFMALAIYGRRLELTDYRDGIKLFAEMNKLGIDLATTVGMIKFITRLYERGVITKKDTDNLELRMGDIKAYMRLLEKMANREGVGDAMARGWYALSERLGVEAHMDDDGDAIIKGTSALYDARFTSLDPTRFGCMVNPKGAMHNHSITYYPNQSIDTIKEFCQNLAMPQESIERIVRNNDFNCGRFERHIEDGEAIYFSLGICVKHIMWEVLSLRLLADFYSVVTGIQMSPEELKEAGERIWNLYKSINEREGFTRADDVCPGLWAKTMDEPIKTSAGEIRLRDYYGRPLTHDDIEKMLDDYYDERGWDIRRGVPTTEKLKELGLP